MASDNVATDRAAAPTSSSAPQPTDQTTSVEMTDLDKGKQPSIASPSDAPADGASSGPAAAAGTVSSTDGPAAGPSSLSAEPAGGDAAAAEKDEAPPPPPADKPTNKSEGDASTPAAAAAADDSLSIEGGGPSSSAAATEPGVCNITLLLQSGSRHPYRIDEKYLAKRGVDVPGAKSGAADPFGISVYTLKELILREWRDDWENKPSSPSSIRLIYFGKMLGDKFTLKDYQFSGTVANVVHMSVKPQDIVDDEEAAKGAAKSAGSRSGGGGSGCCVIL